MEGRQLIIQAIALESADKLNEAIELYNSFFVPVGFTLSDWLLPRYTQGIGVLLQQSRRSSPSMKAAIEAKVGEYLTHTEKLKDRINAQSLGKRCA
jgi:hypothetical protein